MVGIMPEFWVGEPIRIPLAVSRSLTISAFRLLSYRYSFTRIPCFSMPLIMARAMAAVPPHMVSNTTSTRSTVSPLPQDSYRLRMSSMWERQMQPWQLQIILRGRLRTSFTVLGTSFR